MRSVRLTDSRRVASSLRRDFNVFSNTARVASVTTLPSAWDGWLAQQPEELNLAQARYIVTASGSGAWLIPGSVGLCLLFSINPGHYDSECQGLTGPGSPGSGGFYATVQWPGSEAVRVIGVVPNGTRMVTVQMAGGGSEAGPVTANLYDVTVSGEPTALLTKDAGGATIANRLAP